MYSNTEPELRFVDGELISVIVPSFNAEKFIAETIQSVLQQTYTNLELIVVDDFSTDSTAPLVKEFMERDRRVKLIVMPRNSGAPAGPRNVGIRAAAGNWVAFLDADDLWHPKKLELQAVALLREGAMVCSTAMVDFRDSNAIVIGDPGQPSIQKISLIAQLVKYRTPTSSVVVRRQLLLEHPFNEDLRFKAREDTDCFIRVHEYVNYSVKIAYPLVFYRLQVNQISGSKLAMIARHLFMLKSYRLRDGRRLGILAYVFTFSHFLLSIYYRAIKRGL
jgi:teichuronic acid biosynthesis glycosyltransferase TuaG